MINIPVSKPALVKAVTIGTGVASVVVAHFLPQYAGFWADVLRTLGMFGVGVGTVQYVTVPKAVAVQS
jgi:hypothetical protein